MVLDPEEVARLLNAALGLKYKAALSVGACCGSESGQLRRIGSAEKTFGGDNTLEADMILLPQCVLPRMFPVRNGIRTRT